MTRPRRFVALVLLAFGVVGCDHATKGVAKLELEGEPPRVIVAGTLDLRYQQNPGVAFNIERIVPASTRGALVIVVPSLVLGLVGLAWLRRREGPWIEQLSYALILGGAAGNLIDRVVRGYVVDFIHLRAWPTFNVADIAIVVGAVLLLASLARPQPSGAPG